ncbi:GNAT family N-acetyltransferase [Acidisoma cellulosilytica]|uniref:GNAT family N-acetyltransferase n=2 Tax=Acidisoma cellulosilyticum TaxID=2802395 RepID=A0A963Z481_9PROT|nr:GNAT family N-acetyltransferase [Acidisoma cellulosilyticum]
MTLPAGYEISTDPARLDLEVIHHYLTAESYWSQGVPRDVVERAMANSLCFGLYHADTQVGLARVVTDKSTFALIADVFVLDGHRGQGLSKCLMQSIISHPELQGLRRHLLLTSDAHGLYSQFGFQPLGAPARFMEILRADIYKAA